MFLKLIIKTIIIFSISTTAFAIKLSDYTPYNYEVLFTNPVCNTYYYKYPMGTMGGDEVNKKPKNAYCKKGDAVKSASRPNSPEYRLIEWINSPKTKEVFFSYLSFSNKRVSAALCKAIEDRNVKVSFILDRGTKVKVANTLLSCSPNDKFRNKNYPKLHLRGKNADIGYAHNKYFIVNPKSDTDVKIAFSSGNLSSGTVLHHENWHFITTNINSYFAQMHLCMKEGTLHHDDDRATYTKFIKSCRRSITAQEESDIKIFLIPGNGIAAMKKIGEAMLSASSVSIAAHRFSNRKLIGLIDQNLNRGDTKYKLVVDDDLYWIGTKSNFTGGSNMVNEYNQVEYLKNSGLDVRYVQTNHHSYLLHHNKFIIFENSKKITVFAGAGNLTSSAFYSNFENFYYIDIPHVGKAFKKQYQNLFYKLGTEEVHMPLSDIKL